MYKRRILSFIFAIVIGTSSLASALAQNGKQMQDGNMMGAQKKENAMVDHEMNSHRMSKSQKAWKNRKNRRHKKTHKTTNSTTPGMKGNMMD